MPSSNSIVRKAIITIEVELEIDRDDEYIAGELCRRICMHAHVRDANWVKPVPIIKTTERSFIGKCAEN